MYSFGMTLVILVLLDICWYKLFGLLYKLLASLMKDYFPERSSCAPLHTLSKLYDFPVGFVHPLFWGCVWLYLRSPKCGYCSKSDDLSCTFNCFVDITSCGRNTPMANVYKFNCQIWLFRNVSRAWTCFMFKIDHRYNIQSILLSIFWRIHISIFYDTV